MYRFTDTQHKIVMSFKVETRVSNLGKYGLAYRLFLACSCF